MPQMPEVYFILCPFLADLPENGAYRLREKDISIAASKGFPEKIIEK